jgi:hypothetical protein
MAQYEVFETKNILCRYDPLTRIMHIRYNETSLPEDAINGYAWALRIFDVVDVNTIRGSIFDFRRITMFHLSTLNTTRTQSIRMNRSVDLSSHPVALLIKTIYQEKMLGISKAVTPGEDRKRIVRSEDEAVKFLNAWNNKLGRKFDITPELMNAYPHSVTLSS